MLQIYPQNPKRRVWAFCTELYKKPLRGMFTFGSFVVNPLFTFNGIVFKLRKYFENYIYLNLQESGNLAQLPHVFRTWWTGAPATLMCLRADLLTRHEKGKPCCHVYQYLIKSTYYSDSSSKRFESDIDIY